MARLLPTLKLINDYVCKISIDANHHAPDVTSVISPLSQAVIARLNLPHDWVKVYERNGNLGRTCWVKIGGNQYVFSYDHVGRKIVLRDRTTQGADISTFDNKTTQAEIQCKINRL